MSKAPRFVASADAQILYFHLKDHAAASPGEVCMYATLTAAIKRDVQKEARPILNTARRMAEREDRLVFQTVRNVGLKLVRPEEMYELAADQRCKQGRAARRMIRKLDTVDVLAIEDQAVRASTIAERAIQEIVHKGTSAKAVKHLAEAAEPNQRLLSIGEATLKLFK